MNIEEFYAADEARRESTEFEFGTDWTDSRGNQFELSWIEATGELYLMADPNAQVVEDLLFGDALSYTEPLSALSVVVVATIPTHEQVEVALRGWEDAAGQANSLGWLRERFPRQEPEGADAPHSR